MLTPTRAPLVSVVRFASPLGVSPSAFTPSHDGNFSAYNDILETAFSLPGAKAVALQINCPGGTPVCANFLFKRIRTLADQHNIPVFSFVEEMALSGGYLLSLAGDKIIVDDNSLLGSIGVNFQGFGCNELLNHVGIERRVLTKGVNKSFLDPFSKMTEKDRMEWDRIATVVYNNFVDTVMKRRGNVISAKHDMKDMLAPSSEAPVLSDLFSGRIFVGEEAVHQGLADSVDTMHSFFAKKVAHDVQFVPIHRKRSIMERMTGMRGTETGPMTATSCPPVSLGPPILQMDQMLVQAVITALARAAQQTNK